MKFGVRLKNLREEFSLTQQKLSEKVNIAKSTISKYENDLLEPNLEQLSSIAELFNVSTDYLLGRTDDREASIMDMGVVNMSEKLHGSVKLTKKTIEVDTSKPEGQLTNEILAAHADGDLSDEDIERIRQFADFVRSQK